LKNFARAAEHFAKRGFEVWFLGSSQEKDYIDGIYNFISDEKKIRNMAGEFSLKEDLAVLSFCDVFLTNDSGLMNLAYAQNAKVVAIYGANSPNFAHIDNGVNIAIYKKSFCSPCLYIFDDSPCGVFPSCINSITADEAIAAVENVLNNKNKNKTPCFNYIRYDEDSKYIMGTLRKR